MTITVSQLNNYIHGMIDIDGILSTVSVCGEVANLKKSRDGWYFSLKDELASINCFCYDSITPQVGAMVVVDGQVNYFVRNGNVSLFARRLISTKNTGAAYLRFVELKEKLKSEGLFDDERKRAIPYCCKNIGIVTSETGAVIHDIETVALRRQPFVNLFLYPVKVQGIGAAQEIAEGINYFSQAAVDVVIVGRGGGSEEDLSAFNDEAVVRAVAGCAKPVVSAVGHGIDYTLCDFAADKRAATPSEAAEFVTIDVANIKSRIFATLSRIENAASSQLRLRCDNVSLLLKNVSVETNFLLEQANNRVVRMVDNCQRSAKLRFEICEQELKTNVTKLSSLNPMNVLQRGYAYISKDDKPVNTVDDIEISDKITMTMRDGRICAQVLAKEKK